MFCLMTKCYFNHKQHLEILTETKVMLINAFGSVWASTICQLLHKSAYNLHFQQHVRHSSDEREREQVHTRQGNFKFFFQGQGFLCCVKETECLLICQRNVREFYNFQLVSNDENQNMSRAVNNVKGPTSYYIYLSSFTPKPLRRV